MRSFLTYLLKMFKAPHSETQFRLLILLIVLTPILFYTGCNQAANNADTEEWVSLFNGKNLDGWVVKMNHHEVEENWGNTFRVEDSLLKVRYDEYDGFNEQFAHIYYEEPLSYYHLIAEYRFVGEVLPDAPGYANRNSGIMFHSQSPYSMPVDQNWPISIELQLLSGFSDGNPRPTANMCSPGTHVVYNGKLDDTHCINSSSKTYDGDQWVQVELIVLGDSLVTHIVEGDTVLQYTEPQMGGGIVSGYDPEVFQEGKILSEGYIALQSEGQPLDFRKVDLLNLEGCKDPEASNFKSYFIKSDSESCTY